MNAKRVSRLLEEIFMVIKGSKIQFCCKSNELVGHALYHLQENVFS